MLYFSPLSVTDDKQRDRNHPFSFPQCRQAGQNGGGWVCGCVCVWGGGIVPCVSNKTVISIIIYVDRVLDFLWLCCGYWARRPSNHIYRSISELSWCCIWGSCGCLCLGNRSMHLGADLYPEGGWMAASRCVRCMQCLCCGFVLGRRGQLSRRSSIQVDEISCIRDHPRSLLLHTCPHTPTQGDLLVQADSVYGSCSPMHAHTHTHALTRPCADARAR